MNTIKNPRLIWAIIYLLFNTIAFIWILETGYLMGDGEGIPLYNRNLLAFSAFLVSMSIAMIFLLFSFCGSIKLIPVKIDINPKLISIFLLLYYSLFIFYVGLTGLFVAGNSERGGNALSALFVVLNADILFILYYATCRESRYYKYVASIWMASVIQRGWFAYIFVIVGLESFRYIRNGGIRIWHILVILVLVAGYPLIDAVKVYIRIGGGFDIVEFSNIALSQASVVGTSWLETFASIIEKIVGRIQVVSHAYVIIENIGYFYYQLNNEFLNNFWKEGIFGLIFDAFFQLDRVKDVPQHLALYIAPDLESSWNVNPSLVGWVSIYGEYLFLPLAYIGLICVISYLAMSMIGQSQNAYDTLWFIWLIYLIPGWIAQFMGFIFGIVVFISINLLLNMFASRSSA